MKKLSLLTVIVMIFELLISAPSVSASSGFDGYTPLAVCYSPDADVYVAAAKDLTDTNYPMKLYFSSDGSDWKEAISFPQSFYLGGKPQAKSHQCLIYWESEGVFVAAVGRELYKSTNGENWELLGTANHDAIITVNGTELFVASYGEVKVFTSLTDSYVVKTTGTWWIKFLLPKDDTVYAGGIDTQWGAYRNILKKTDGAYSAVNVAGMYRENPNTNNVYLPYNGLYLLPNAQSHANAHRLTLFNTETGGTDRKKIIVTNSDGSKTEVMDKIVSVGYINDGKDNTFVGTLGGKIYYTEATNLTNDTVWYEATGSENGECIETLTTGKNNSIIALTQNKTYAVIKESGRFVRLGTDEATVMLDNETSVEIPVSGVNELKIVPKLVNYAGNAISSSVDSVSVKGTLPDGITFSDNKIKVESTTLNGCTVTVSVTYNSKEYDFNIDILAETSAEITGEKSIIVPSWGKPSVQEAYSLKIYDQNGNEMTRDFEISAVSLPNDVTFDISSNTLTVPYTAEGGTAILEGKSKSKPSVTAKAEINIEINEPDKVIIDKSLSVISVSDTKAVKIPLNAELYNKTGESVSQEALTWSVTDVNGKEISGVTIDDSAKTAEFAAGFSVDAVKFKATAKGYPKVYDEIVAVVLYNDAKKIEADLEYVAGAYNFVNISNDVTLNAEAPHGSSLTWTSSDMGVISSSGEIAQSPTSKTAEMTVTLNLGAETRTYVFPVVLSDISNILKNGNFEKGDLSSWTSADSEICTDNVNEGEYVALVKNSLKQSVEVKKDRVYAISAFAKKKTADSVKISLGSDMIAEKALSDSYSEITGLYIAKSDMTAEFAVTASGEFYLDDVKLSDITDKYNDAVSAVTAAEESKLKTDCDYALTLIDAIPESAEKTALIARINAINTTKFEEMNLGNYTLLTSAYNSEDNILVAVAKDFTNSDNPAKIYMSADGGAMWQLTHSEENAKNSNYSSTKQVLTYWEAQKAFVAILGSKVYYSHDGTQWTRLEAMDMSSGYIVSNGNILFTAGARSGKSASDLSGAFTEITTKGGSNFTANFVTATDKGYGFYQNLNVGISYPTTAYYTAYNSKTSAYESTAYYPGAYGYVSDVNYSEDLSKWILTTSSDPSYRVLTEPSSFSSALTPNLGVKTDGYTASLYDNKVIYVATKEGQIFKGNAADVTKVTGWEELKYETSVDSEPASFQKLSDGTILLIAKKDIYLIDGNTVTQNQKKYSVGLNEDARIEVPSSGEKVYTFTAHSKLYTGENTPYTVVGLKPKNELPSGILFKSTGDNSCEITVSSYAEGGKNIILNIALSNGVTKEVEIKVVTEMNLDLGGKELIVIPRTGENEEIYKYEPKAIGQDNEPINREIVFNVLSVPDGISYNSAEKTFIVTSESGEGTILIKAYTKEKPSLAKTFSVKVEKRRAEKLQFESADSYSITVPDSGSLSIKTPAYVYDQSGIRINENVTYTLTDESGNEYKDVSMSGENLVVSSKAFGGTLKLKASASEGQLTDEVTFTLSLTDTRKLLEDYNYILSLNNFSEMTKNANLPASGIYGSAIKYKSSNESVITSDGILTRDYTKNTSAILTLTLTLNDSKLTKNVNVISLKQDNIADNGNVELGTTDGWTGDSLAVTDEAHSGNHALFAPNGAAYRVTLKNDRTYAAVVFVKAQSGDVKLSYNGTALSKSTAQNGYKKLDGIFTLSKNGSADVRIDILGTNVTIDDLSVFEITAEYEKVTELVASAEIKRTKDAVNTAKAALDNFYDLSIKDELYDRLSKIKIKADNEGGSSSGGGGGGGGGSIITPSTPSTSIPDNSEKVEYNSLKFKDLMNHWAKDDVEFMGAKGFVNGKADGVFDPDSYVTRAEFTALLVRAMELSEKDYANSFFDVVSDDWFSKSVQTARDEKYVMGSNGLFRPYDLITREEMTKMIVSAYNEKANKTLESGKAIYYSDIYNISAWAYDYIAEAVDEGLVNGMSETRFEPKQNATRAQAVVMLKRLYSKLNAE